jgi:predicted dinucleotide-binding enzyme
MNIVIIGQGNVGGGLAAQWRRTGHQVTAPGRGSRDASGADVVVMAVPGPAISAAMDMVTGLSSKIAIDATSALPFRNEAFGSLAEVSFTAGPVAQRFNLNFAILYDQIAAQRVRPSSFYVAKDDARTVTEELITDAGYDPVPLGGLDRTRAPEYLTWLLIAAMKDGAPVFYRFAVPGEL